MLPSGVRPTQAWGGCWSLAPRRLRRAFQFAGLSLAATSLAADDGARLTFTWNDVSENEAGFVVERSSDGTAFVPVAAVGADRTSFVDTGLADGTRYWYRVCAFNGNGRSEPSSAASGVATLASSPAPPAVRGLVDHWVDRGTPVTLDVALDDADSAADTLHVSMESSNLALVSAVDVAWSPSPYQRQIAIRPATGQLGSTKLTLVVQDGTFTTRTSFVLTVFANTPPAVGVLADRRIVQNSTTGSIRLAVEDGETPAANLSVNFTSSRPDIVPLSGISLGGRGDQRTVTITPRPQAIGTSTIGVRVSDSGLTTEREFTLTVTAPTQGRLLNVSSRVHAPRENPPIVGLVVAGNPKRVLLRSVGPTLGAHPFHVPSVLPNPRLRVLQHTADGYVERARNSDWTTDNHAPSIAAATAEVFAFGLAPDSRDAALLLALPAGQYTMLAEDEDGADGVALVETYDADGSTCEGHLINLSTRGFVGDGSQVLIMGFVVAADGPQTVLLRAVGPTLAAAPFRVPGVLNDPVLELYATDPHGRSTMICVQDDWGDAFDAGYTAAIASRVSAFTLPTTSQDAAFVLTLAPGIYTAIVRGKNGGCGTALAELYAVR